MKNILRTLGLLVVAATLALAAGIDGTWKAEFTTPDGTQRNNTYTFKADGEKLTGKIASQMGEAEIKNGTVKGDDVNFEVTRKFQDQEFTMKYAGKLSGDELKLTVSFNENSFPIVAKRQ